MISSKFFPPSEFEMGCAADICCKKKKCCKKYKKKGVYCKKCPKKE